MMTVFFILLALMFAGLITELVAANRAPYGYQDESGFHFGREHGNPSPTVELENPS
jgi:hypothetical protein